MEERKAMPDAGMSYTKEQVSEWTHEEMDAYLQSAKKQAHDYRQRELQAVRGGEQASFAYNSSRHMRRAAAAKARKGK